MMGVRFIKGSTTLALLYAVAGCSHDTVSNVTAPGAQKAPDTRALDAGAALLQSRPPIDALNAYLDGFHFYNGHPGAQMEAHHYCAILNEEVIQCVIYDGNQKDAKLMGVEYIISAQLYANLPAAEKPLWHSHVHEVKSGQLVAPGLPAPAEHALMDKLVNTYGKTWHTWHTDLDKTLPLGVPQLMMGFTADGQVDPALVAQRDHRLGIDSNRLKADRADIPAPPVNPAADAWQHGKVIQLTDPTGQQQGAMHHGPVGVPVPPTQNAHTIKP
ncbi:OBAP family protein [Pseudomonas sp. LY10J]